MAEAFDISGIRLGGGAPIVLVAGPCVLESESLANDTCGRILDITARLGMPFIFKSSYDKANRQSSDSYRGPGIAYGLDILAGIRKKFGVPVVTDIHTSEEALTAGAVVDVVQLPAFLCRQTDLALACGETRKPVFVKKGQFMAPEDMRGTVEKIRRGGSDRVALIERGTSFGYHDLVVDMRSLPILRSLGVPVLFDCTHSVQRPGAAGTGSGGNPEFIAILARAAVAVGVDGVFIETHPDCASAKCDAATMLPLDRLEGLLKVLMEIDRVVKG